MSSSENNQPDILASDLLQLVGALVRDIQPRTQELKLTLDSTLDKDLGLDSLARIELLARLEKRFNITLPAQLIMEAETPRILLQMMVNQGLLVSAPEAPEIFGLDMATGTRDLPDEVSNLVELLDWHVQYHPERTHIHIIDEDSQPETLDYQQLQQQAGTIAAGLQYSGVAPGDKVAIMLPTGRDYFISFYGVLIAGAVPVPIYPPIRMNQIEDHLHRHCGILSNCKAVSLITFPEARMFARLLKSNVSSMRNVISVDELLSTTHILVRPSISSSDLAFLQYTSGSTGNPKGVVLTHYNLLTNIRCMGHAVQATSDDVFVSWLPLYHDMGLIGAWLGSLYFAMPLVIMSPLSFLSRPRRWFEAIHRFRGTMSAAPNFAYELCLKRIDKQDLEGLDLSCWRLAFNGAEAVSPLSLEAFSERFSETGLSRQSLTPVYGLAESSVGLAFPPLHRGPLIDRIQRSTFMKTGYAMKADEGDQNALQFVACGQPLAGHQIRVVDETRKELPDRYEGLVEFQGPSSTQGYFDNPEETRKLFNDGWLDTGDLGYIAEGDVYITGRSKDIIIRAGRNIYPHELEEYIGGIEGIRRGCVAVFGATEEKRGTEKLVVLAESYEQNTARVEQLRLEINSVTTDLIGTPADDIVIAPPHTVLKTSSGKIRRSACRVLYEQGELGHTQQAVWRQMVNITLTSIRPSLRRLRHRAGSTAYTAYAWTIFMLLAVPTWCLTILIPTQRWRWSFIRRSARLAIWLTGNRLTIRGDAGLPDSGCIIVSNHASYLDGIFLVAALPGSYSFVAKGEFRKQFIAGTFLRHIGSYFVERFDRSKGLVDLQALQAETRGPKTLIFFPEGTFSRIPGLSSFHLGAFITAAEHKVPIVPVAIRGTRSLLRANTWSPNRSHIIVNIGDPISPTAQPAPDQSEWQTAISLRDAARQYILRFCGEPDIDNQR